MAHAVKSDTLKGTGKSSQAEVEAQRRRAAIDRTRGVLAALAPGRSLVDELIAQRRSEARSEEHPKAHTLKSAPAMAQAGRQAEAKRRGGKH